MYGPYIYKVLVYDDIKKENTHLAGITFAHKWSEAVAHMENYYGNTLICIEQMDELEEDDLIEIPIEIAEGLVNGTL